MARNCHQSSCWEQRALGPGPLSTGAARRPSGSSLSLSESYRYHTMNTCHLIFMENNQTTKLFLTVKLRWTLSSSEDVGTHPGAQESELQGRPLLSPALHAPRHTCRLKGRLVVLPRGDPGCSQGRGLGPWAQTASTSEPGWSSPTAYSNPPRPPAPGLF